MFNALIDFGKKAMNLYDKSDYTEQEKTRDLNKHSDSFAKLRSSLVKMVIFLVAGTLILKMFILPYLLLFALTNENANIVNIIKDNIAFIDANFAAIFGTFTTIVTASFGVSGIKEWKNPKSKILEMEIKSKEMDKNKPNKHHITLYGQISKNHTKESIDLVCSVLGDDNNITSETITAETHYGMLEDRSIGAGMGISQFDEMPFNDIKNRCDKYRSSILTGIGIDIRLVEWQHLRYSPLLGVLFCRLKYKLIPEKIPNTVSLRAKYWKQWYNSKLGKGTTAHYIELNT